MTMSSVVAIAAVEVAAFDYFVLVAAFSVTNDLTVIVKVISMEIFEAMELFHY